MKMTHQFCHALAGMCLLLTTIPIISDCAASAEASLTHERAVPEIFLRNDVPQPCLSRIDLTPLGAFATRRRLLFDVVENAHAISHREHIGFTFARVDYASFRSMDVVFACVNGSSVIRIIRAAFSKYAGKIPPIQDGADTRGLFVRLHDVRGIHPLTMFEKYRSEDKIASCMFSITLSEREYKKQLAEYMALYKIGHKYKFPIVDMTLIDGTTYVLLGRQCEQKQAIFGALKEAVAREKPSALTQLGRPNFNPDIEAYFFQETGRHFRRK